MLRLYVFKKYSLEKNIQPNATYFLIFQHNMYILQIQILEEINKSIINSFDKHKNVPIYITNGMKATWYEVLTISVTVSNRDLIPGFNNPIFEDGFFVVVIFLLGNQFVFSQNIVLQI